MNKQLYENIINGIQKGIKRSLLNENADKPDIFSFVKDDSYIEILNNIKEQCYEADKNHINSIQSMSEKYWDIAEIVIGNSKQFGEIWDVTWNSNMNGHYKSRINCKDISEYVLYSIDITYKDESDHTCTLYFGENYLLPYSKRRGKTQEMTKKDICFFYEYIEKLVWETKNQDIADSWREDERNYDENQRRKQQEKEERLRREKEERLAKEEERRKIIEMQKDWIEKMSDLIYEYASKKLSRRKNIFVKKSVGSSQAEGSIPYTAIVFYEDKISPYAQIGRIRVDYNEIDLAVPLCGHQWMKITEDNYEKRIDYCIDFILN